MQKIFLGLVTSFLFSSCYYGVYAPGAVYAPLFTDSGQVTMAIHTGISPFGGEGVTAHIGYAYSPQKAILLDYEEYNHLGDKTFGSGKQLNIALGRFTQNKPESEFVGEGFAGLGLLNINGVYDKKQYSVTGLKAFMQGDVGVKSRYFDLAIGLRVSGIKYVNLWNDDTKMRSGVIYDSGDPDEYLDACNLLGGAKLFVEPFASVRAGFKLIKVEFRYALAGQILGKPVPYYSELFSFGLNFQMPYSHKKKR